MPRPDDEDDYDDRPRRRDDRDDYDHGDRPRRRRRDDDGGPPPPAGNGYAMASLTLALLSVVTCLLTGLPAIVFAILGLKRASLNGRGRGVSIAAIIITVLTTIVWMASLPYAVVRVRDAALRARTTNNGKQIGLAMHNMSDIDGGLPFAYTTSDMPKDESPAATPLDRRLMSWRTRILPMLEQDALFMQYDASQPWNAGRNQVVTSTVVKSYLTDQPESNQTRFRVFTGPNTLFAPGQPQVRIDAIRDGMSNTLLVVEGAEPGPWAEPRDLEITPTGPLPQLGQPHRDTVMVILADGSVRQMKKSIDPRVLRNLIDPNDGAAIPPDQMP